MRLKLYDKRRFKDRWSLRLGHWFYLLKHPLVYFWYQELSEDDDFKQAAQYKRPICWIKGHDFEDVAGEEYWANSMTVSTKYYSVCVRCFKT